MHFDFKELFDRHWKQIFYGFCIVLIIWFTYITEWPRGLVLLFTYDPFALPYQREPFMGGLRFLMMSGSALIGFAIGWFLSPEAKHIRKWLFIGLVLVLGLAAFLNNGPIGWSLTLILSVILFSVCLGMWAASYVDYLTQKPMTFGSSEWADFDHLEDHHVFDREGFRLGQFHSHEGEAFQMSYTKDRHLLTVAPTRSGKGVSMILPNLLTYHGSCLVIDPKGENAIITAEQRQAMGQDVYVVDPWCITDLPVARFNPLDWLIVGDVDMTENAMLLADALVVTTGENDQFWIEESKALLQGLILYVATDEGERAKRTLSRVRELLLLDQEDLQTLFKQMMDSPHHIVASTGARCLQKEERLLTNVIASAQAQTHFLDSSRIQESLAVSDFKFEDLKSQNMTIYLVLPADRLNAFGRWLCLLIQQALTVNARNIEIKPQKPVLFLLDEMPALGRLTMVEQAFGLMAGYGIQLWGIVQDLSQLKRIYGDGWETFISNAGVLQYFGSRDQMTAEYFSNLCGVTTVWNFSTALARACGSNHGQGGFSSSTSETTTDTSSAIQRKLAYADELMRMHENKQLLLIENLNPIQGIKTPWFKDHHLMHLGKNLHG